MKQLFIIPVFVAMISSCSNPVADKVENFIPGTYVKEINDEFSKGMDTLKIAVLDKSAGSYSIKRGMRYQQTIDGKTLSPQYKEENWTAIYNEDTHQLMEQKNGKIFSFMPEHGTLSMGSSEYKKIK